MASEGFLQQVQAETMALLRKEASVVMQNVESVPAQSKEIADLIAKVVNEHTQHSQALSGVEAGDAQEVLLKQLPSDRTKAIQQGLQVPTFSLNIARHSDDGKYHAHFTRDGKQFAPSLVLDSQNGLLDATWKQMASILIEAILLVLSIVGIKTHISAKVMAEAVDAAEAAIKSSSAVQQAMDALEKVMENSSSSFYDKAKAIFLLLKATNAAGVFMQLVKALLKDMSAWDWAKAAAIITANIVAAFATDGAALIAKITLALNSAYEFMKKFTNLSHLSYVKTTLDQ